jgi:hypothetical protein
MLLIAAPAQVGAMNPGPAAALVRTDKHSVSHLERPSEATRGATFGPDLNPPSLGSDERRMS